MAAAKDVSAMSNPKMKELAKAISSGSLRGARGNSGVILSQILKGIAKGASKVTILMAYPEDEVGNDLFDEELLYKYNINPWGDVLTEEEYNKYFGNELHRQFANRCSQ